MNPYDATTEPTCMEEEFGPLEDRECTWCGGEGFFVGTDTPGFDHINDDPEETYDCPACGGTGDREHQRIF